MKDIKLKPCPFCGSTPSFPLVKDVYGTCLEADCQNCGMASVSIQIIDCFDYEGSPNRAEAHASYCEKTIQYGFHYIGIARDIAIAEWNTRHDDALTSRVAELEASLKKIRNVVGVQSSQGACWDDEIALEHSEAVDTVYKMATKALEDKS
jgi:hypothetical protein